MVVELRGPQVSLGYYDTALEAAVAAAKFKAKAADAPVPVIISRRWQVEQSAAAVEERVEVVARGCRQRVDCREGTLDSRLGGGTVQRPRGSASAVRIGGEAESVSSRS